MMLKNERMIHTAREVNQGVFEVISGGNMADFPVCGFLMRIGGDRIEGISM